MALIDLWNSDRSQVTDKRLEQLIAFAGEGKLRDGNDTSIELRALLARANIDEQFIMVIDALGSRAARKASA